MFIVSLGFDVSFAYPSHKPFSMNAVGILGKRPYVEPSVYVGPVCVKIFLQPPQVYLSEQAFNHS